MNLDTSARRSTGRGIVLAVVAAAIVSGIVCTVIALVARALGADATKVGGLNPPAYLLFLVVGLIIAAVVWSIVRSRAGDPARVMRVLVPVVVVVSLVPDLLIGIAGFGWIGAIALMVMHLAVAAAGVTAFRRFLPLPA